jgi:hypothetical protein
MSTLKVSAIQNLSGRERFLADAWVNFNGTGTVAIRGSGNVSSITDNGTGDYTINFATALADANYAVVATCRRSTLGNTAFSNIVSAAAALAAGSCRIGSPNDAGTPIDAEEICVVVFR